MTVPTPPTGPHGLSDDEFELVHAYLDGEATPADAARLEADSALVAAVDQARRTRDAVRDQLRVGPAGEAQRTAHLDAALAAFRAAAGADSSALDTSTTQAPADLTARRQRKAWYQRVPLPAVAAAAILIVVAAIAGVSQLGSDTAPDLTAVADDLTGGAAQVLPDVPMALEVEDGEADTFMFDADAAGPEDAMLDPDLPRRGLDAQAYDTVDEFVAGLKATPATTSTMSDQEAANDSPVPTGPTEAGLLARCPDLAAQYAELPDAYQVWAEVDGAEVIGVVFTTHDGDTAIHVIAVASCELLVEA